MIFNTSIYIASFLSDSDFVTLLMVKDKAWNALYERHGDCQNLMVRGWLDTVKPKKGQSEVETYRLSKKAKAFLIDLEVPELTEERKQVARSLISLYQEHNLEEKIGNRRKVLRDVCWFMAETDAGELTIVTSVDDYLSATTDKSYVKKLENLIHELPNAFATKYQIENSYLYTLIRR